MKTNDLVGTRIHITGVVQGVGFRPFVYGLATRLALTGWVRNTSAGVDIVVDGAPNSTQAFIEALKSEAPPLARIDEFEVEQTGPDGFTTFEIAESEVIPDAFQPVSPDVSICPDCLRELFDPTDRRYRYPFINCTNCGPRFTIIEDIPYDRPKTTMAGFDMCPDCAAEYGNPLDRRFHAQPVACPICGPQVWLEAGSRLSQQFTDNREGDSAIRQAQRLLAEGQILAVKGLGGFHLACDATDRQAVAELRRRKLRVDKPFALMVPDMETIEANCFVGAEERALLASRERPIVILRRKPGSKIAAEVAPLQDTLGVMLPYTPLHYLLLTPPPATAGEVNPAQPESQKFTPATILVMTSGNLREEPIAIDNDEARHRLANLVDAFLMHDRPIRTRCDDSVVRIFYPDHTRRGDKNSVLPGEAILPIRRSRGYAPFPVRLAWESPPLLATGAELKNTFCLTNARYAFLSHHIGDLENYETLQSFEDGIAHFERLFKVRPQALAYDLHPNYLSSRYALERAESQGLPAMGIQHHHAHIAACMAENGLPEDNPVIGVSFDGTGYGDDGAIWGGEFLLADYRSYQRSAHLAYTPLPGGDAAVHKPARTALAYLWQAGLDWSAELPPVAEFCADERAALRSQLEHGLNAPLTSSMGRLFDAVSSLAGVRQKVNYEAQAAIELEALVDTEEKGLYLFEIEDCVTAPIPSGAGAASIDSKPLIEAVASDYLHGIPVAKIAARFHNAVSFMVLEICRMIRSQTGINAVILSGGVWQNVTLLGKTVKSLQDARFAVYIHHWVPPNDGGIALGQAAVAAHRLARPV